MPVEPPKFDAKTNEIKDQAYKQLNKLAQGSAADMTKAAIVAYGATGSPARLLLTVYDEIDVSAPADQVGSVEAGLNSCMVNALPCDVPMRVDLARGPNWGELQ
jgi:DNA polymerase I-like protein with 3'-5' exonuclease and polymerase domains